MVEIGISPSDLYEGSLQAAITHAVAVGMYPELNYEHSWDGINYCMNDSQGCRAAITFHPEYIVAVFQDSRKMDANTDAMTYFEGADDSLIEIAKEEALQYVLENIGGVARPVVTAAFGGTWEQLYSAQSFERLMENGGYIIANQMNSYEAAAKEWQEYYDLDAQQMNFIRTLFDKKMKSGGRQVRLDADDTRFLHGDADECLASLEELNIVR